MASKDLSRVERRTVASAVAKRYPDLSPGDQQKYVDHVLEFVADAITRGGYPASVIPIAGDKVQIDYLTIEKILDETVELP
jgi:hypothetical protein